MAGPGTEALVEAIRASIASGDVVAHGGPTSYTVNPTETDPAPSVGDIVVEDALVDELSRVSESLEPLEGVVGLLVRGVQWSGPDVCHVSVVRLVETDHVR